MREGETEIRCYEDLYRLKYEFVYRYIKRMIQDDYAAEDLTQEVFLVAFKKWESDVCAHPNVPGFLIRVAQNKLKKWYEKNSRTFVDETGVIEFLEATSVQLDGMTEFKKSEFYATLEKILSVEEMDLLRYYYEYDYTSAEMAKILNLSESCFRMRMTRMRNKLKKYLGTISALIICVLCWF